MSEPGAPQTPPVQGPPTGLSIADRLSLPRIHWAWLLFLAAFIALFWTARSVIGPFIAGFILAYLLDPPTHWLQARGLPRWAAAAVSLLLFILAFCAIILATAPIIEAQISHLITAFPKIIDETIPAAEKLLDGNTIVGNSRDIISNLGTRIASWLSNSVGALLAGSLALVNIVTFLVVTPVVAYYLLRDWRGILAEIESWWPRRQLPMIKSVLADSNAALSGFVRGQSLVCLALAVFYAVGWSLVGLQYGVVLGILAGVLGFVPFLGVLFAVSMSVIVALGQWGFDWVHIGMVLGVFAVGQALESSVLTPNLIGNRIGLHPVWVLFAVFAGGQVAGLAGVFLAVPVAAVLGVIVRRALAHYRQSWFYGPDAGA
jgi:predicted PurR-regulated permease PerM